MTGIPTPRQHILTDLAAGEAFAQQVGFPVIVKPDIGVGANGACKLNTQEDLLAFYKDLPSEPYVMEEFLYGDICTYDAVIDSHCEPLFESMCTYASVIDTVQNDENIHFYTTADVPEKLRQPGRKTAKAFQADRRLSPSSDERYYCAYEARKDGHDFTHTHEEIMDRYGRSIVMQEEMPPIDWPSMGRYVYMARFTEKTEMERYFAFVLE